MGDTNYIRIGNDINIKFKIEEDAGFTAENVCEVICFIMKKDSNHCHSGHCKFDCCEDENKYTLCCGHPVYNTVPHNHYFVMPDGGLYHHHHHHHDCIHHHHRHHCDHLHNSIDYQNHTQRCKHARVVYTSSCIYQNGAFHTIYPAHEQLECGSYYVIIQYNINNKCIQSSYTYEYDNVFELVCRAGHQGYCLIYLNGDNSEPEVPEVKDNVCKVYTLSEDVFNYRPTAEQLEKDHSYFEFEMKDNKRNINFNVYDDNRVIVQSGCKLSSISQGNLLNDYTEYRSGDYYMYQLNVDWLKNHNHTVTIEK